MMEVPKNTEDMFKFLTRGSALHKSKEGRARAAEASKPRVLTPQLYHGSKRKRDVEQDDMEELQDWYKEENPDKAVDFFAKTAKGKGKGKGKGKKDAKSEPTNSENVETEPTLLAEEECRQIFQLHRVRLTVMPLDKDVGAGTVHESSENEIDELQPKKKRKKNTKKTKDQDEDKTSKKNHKKKPFFPQPMQSLAELRSLYGMPQCMVENLHNLHYRVPTEIQLGCLPMMLDPAKALAKCSKAPPMDDFTAQQLDRAETEGLNLISVAPTGSGKTMTFMIPTVGHIYKRRAAMKAKPGNSCQPVLEAIIVAPTKELATQIAFVGKKLAKGTGIKVVRLLKTMRVEADQSAAVEGSTNETCSGDDIHVNNDAPGEDGDNESNSGDDEEGYSSDESQTTKNNNQKIQKSLKKKKNVPSVPLKADILVTTPGLLARLLASGQTLPSVLHLVLDEVDVLVNPLFMPETSKIWDACTNPALRASFWASTISSTIETILANQIKTRADTIAHVAPPLVRAIVGLKDTAVPTATHHLMFGLHERGKLYALRQLLRPAPGDTEAIRVPYPYIIFTQTVERAQQLWEEIRYDLGLSDDGRPRTAVLHSALEPRARRNVMQRLRSGDPSLWVLVTTDVLMRGIDLPHLRGVVNYDIPTTPAAYVHRAGRAGRAGRDGVVVTLWALEDKPYLKAIAKVIRLSEQQAGIPVEKSGVSQGLFDKLPNVGRNEKKQLRRSGGVPERRPGAPKITTTSGWDLRKENNLKGAVAASKRNPARNKSQTASGSSQNRNVAANDEWAGFDD